MHEYVRWTTQQDKYGRIMKQRNDESRHNTGWGNNASRERTHSYKSHITNTTHVKRRQQEHHHQQEQQTKIPTKEQTQTQEWTHEHKWKKVKRHKQKSERRTVKQDATRQTAIVIKWRCLCSIANSGGMVETSISTCNETNQMQAILKLNIPREDHTHNIGWWFTFSSLVPISEVAKHACFAAFWQTAFPRINKNVCNRERHGSPRAHTLSAGATACTELLETYVG